MDSYTLGGTTPILDIFPGVFNNGGAALELPEAPGTVVYVEIRAWRGGFASYEEAITGGGPGIDVGRGGRLKAITLGGGAVPTPNLVIQGGFTGFAIGIPEPSAWILGLMGFALMAIYFARGQSHGATVQR